jgi:hypothetical protein
MATLIVTLVSKPNAKNPLPSDKYYDAENVTYLGSNGTPISTEGKTIASGSNGEYYLIDKSLKKSDEAEFNSQKMAVALRNLENRFGKHAYQIFHQFSKLIDLVNSNQPCDPAWVDSFLADLAKSATAFKSAGERNESKFENWTPEPTEQAVQTDSEVKQWTPIS